MKTLADTIVEFANSDIGQDFKRKMQIEREKSPARFNRQFDHQLIMLSMEVNARCKIIAYNTELLEDADDDMTHQEFDDVFKQRAEEIHACSEALRKLESRKKLLDQAVIDEDNNK